MEPRIFWAGDSTVTQNNYTTYPQSGIGQGIRLFVRKEIEIKNHAINGKSTKSFLDESRLACIYDELTQGDFLFVQFGHNDEKEQDTARYAAPFGAYKENLGKFISAARNKKAYPLLITPLARLIFLKDGMLDPADHKDYRLAMKQTAQEWNVPCVDLCGASRYLLEHTPQEVSRQWYMNLEAGKYPNFPQGAEDNTHLQWEGALIFGRLLAAGLKALGGIYADLLIEPEQLNDDFNGEICNG